MKRTFTFLLPVMAVLFFTACKREESINIDQNRIYADYSYEFDAEKNQSSMTATFRLDNSGGKKLKLSYPARVDFEGSGLTWRGAFGHYQLTNSWNAAGGRFNYFNNDEKQFSNEIAAPPSTELPFGLTSISRAGNFFLPWTGGPLGAGEVIRVRIDGVTDQTFTTSQLGATHIILDQNGLQQLTPGNATITIEREKRSGVQQGNLSGGQITSRYKSRRVHITIAG